MRRVSGGDCLGLRTLPRPFAGLKEKESISERHVALVEAQNNILAHIAADAPLSETMLALTSHRIAYGICRANGSKVA